MKFVHSADFHLGAWRDEKLNQLSLEAFEQFIDKVCAIMPDFVLIAGDLFNTPLPRIEILRLVVEKFKLLKSKNIPVVLISGSHDFSPTGKTFLSVLESADLCLNAEHFNESGELDGVVLGDVFVAGIGGRARMADSQFYEDLVISEKRMKSAGYKIFMFHNSIEDIFPKFGGISVSALPTGFNYYAGGHIHLVKNEKGVVFPGPIFPNNFQEIQELRNGGFFIYDDSKSNPLSYIPIKIKSVESIVVSGEMSAEQFYLNIMSELNKRDIEDKLVLIKLKGVMKKGNFVTQINFKEILDNAYSKGAYYVMKNTNSLVREEYEKTNVEVSSEDEVIRQIVEAKSGDLKIKLNTDEKKNLILSLLNSLSVEKQEGEKREDFENRMISDTDSVFSEYFNYF